MIVKKIPPFEDVFEIFPDIYEDDRGFFFESYSQKTFNKKLGINVKFVQDNHSKSNKNVIRGLHFQEEPLSQQKLLRCVKGRVLEVIVNINPKSKNFLRHAFLEINPTLNNQLFIPNGYAHGFLSLEDNSHLIYKTDNFYSAERQITLKWNDPTVNITWPIDNNLVKLSKRDQLAISFKKYFKL